MNLKLNCNETTVFYLMGHCFKCRISRVRKETPQMEMNSCAVKYNTELLFILTFIFELCKLPTARTV